MLPNEAIGALKLINLKGVHPFCGRDVLMDRSDYCPDCGQALDWSDNND